MKLAYLTRKSKIYLFHRTDAKTMINKNDILKTSQKVSDLSDLPFFLTLPYITLKI